MSGIKLNRIIVAFLQETNNLKICTSTIKILSLLILKNKIVNDNDRSVIRKIFINPTNFKSILDAFKTVQQKFGEKENNQENIIRLIRIINCTYIKKGNQILSKISYAVYNSKQSRPVHVN